MVLFALRSRVATDLTFCGIAVGVGLVVDDMGVVRAAEMVFVAESIFVTDHALVGGRHKRKLKSLSLGGGGVSGSDGNVDGSGGRWSGEEVIYIP